LAFFKLNIYLIIKGSYISRILWWKSGMGWCRKHPNCGFHVCWRNIRKT